MKKKLFLFLILLIPFNVFAEENFYDFEIIKSEYVCTDITCTYSDTISLVVNKDVNLAVEGKNIVLDIIKKDSMYTSFESSEYFNISFIETKELDSLEYADYTDYNFEIIPVDSELTLLENNEYIVGVFNYSFSIDDPYNENYFYFFDYDLECLPELVSPQTGINILDTASFIFLIFIGFIFIYKVNKNKDFLKKI